MGQHVLMARLSDQRPAATSPHGRRAAWVWAAAGLMVSALAFPNLAMGQGTGGPEAPPQPKPVPIEKEREKPEEPPAAPATPDMATPSLLVTEFMIRYAGEDQHPGLPTLESLLKNARVSLTRTDDGFIRGQPGTAGQTLEDLNVAVKAQEGGIKFSPEALTSVLLALRDALLREGLIGVFAEYDPEELTADVQTGEFVDLRENLDGRTTLGVNVYAAIVTRLRTVAAGERIKSEIKVDNPLHAGIKADSPVKPTPEGQTERRDLLRREALDDFVLKLNRHPGRRVDVAISGEEEETARAVPGAVVLDYLVRENDPLLLYFQVSNTGTEQTEKWRERFGLIHYQLTGHDDILSLDYVTGGFEKTHIFNGYYELPIFSRDLRLKVFGGYNQFDASQVGRAAGTFNGDSYSVGGELDYNLAQIKETFINVFAAIRYQSVRVQNTTNPVQPLEGETPFLLPSFGMRLERLTDEAATNASVAVEFNLPEAAGTDQNELIRLGRLGAEREWQALQWNFEQTLYLEPIFDRERFLASQSTLAHEVAFAFKGQHAFGNLLAPNFQSVAGGLYTVRGYPESIVAGDTVFIVSGEYRLHIPRLFAPAAPGKLFGEDFRFVPNQPYARPDWDIIFKAFVDLGNTKSSGNSPIEPDETLVGAGIGLEFQFKRFLNIRLDYGFALDEVREVGTGRNVINEGDGRFHFVATLLF